MQLTLPVTHSGHDYYNEATLSPASPVTLDATNTFHDITFDTHENLTGVNGNGEIHIQIAADGTNYNPASTMATIVTVQDKETIPEVTIARVSDAMIEEGETAVFELTAGTPGVNANFDATVRVTQTGTGNFLATTPPYNRMVQLSTGTNKGTFRVPTMADATDEDDVTISVTVQADPNASDSTKPQNYTASATAATITIQDNDAPGATTTVTVSGPTRVYESQSADFTFTATPAPSGDDKVTVNYRISEVGSFLTTSANTPISGTIDIGSGGTKVLSLPTSSDKDVEDDGSVSVQVLAHTTGAIVYNVGVKPDGSTDPDYIATAELVDDDDVNLPNMTIASVTSPVGEADSPTVDFRITAEALAGGTLGTDSLTVSVQISQEGDFLSGSAETRRETLADRSNPHIFSVGIRNDSFDEENGKVNATLVPDTTETPVYSVGTNYRAEIVIQDDDLPRNIRISDESEPEGNAESENKTMTFEVTMSRATNQTISVNYTIGKQGDTAILGTDYTVSPTSGTIVFESSQTRKTIVIDLIEDTTPEQDKTFTITLSKPDPEENLRDATIAKAEGTGTIQNDDGAIVSNLTVAPESIAEGNSGTSTMTFTVTADPPAAEGFTVDWATSVEMGDTATADNDFSTASNTLTFAATDTMKTFTVDIMGDTIPEHPETFTVTISNPSTGGRVTGDGTAKGTINNDDGTGISIAASSLTEGALNSNSNMTFTVSVIPPINSTITYDWATSVVDGTDNATAGADFMTTTRAGVTITADAESDTFTVPIIGDDTPEPDETFTVTLSNVTGASVINATAQGTIENDDGSSLTIASVEQPEGSTSNKMMFTVTASPPAESQFTVDWATSVVDGEDNATAGSDFTSANNTLTFNVDDPSKTFEIDILGDTTPEFDETFTVTLSSVNGDAEIDGDGTAKGTIENDDGSGLSIADTSLVEGASGETQMTFTVSVIPPSATQIMYDWATSDDSGDSAAEAGTDYTAASDTGVMIAAMEMTDTFTVPISGDTVPEPDETFTVTLSNPTGATIIKPTAKGTITNDDGSLLSIENVSLAEGADTETPTMTFTITATPPASRDFSVNWTASSEMGDTATDGADYTAGSGKVDFMAGDPK